MLNQSANDREDLAKLINISEEQMWYITNTPTGSGLIKYGSSIVPFVNKMQNDYCMIWILQNLVIENLPFKALNILFVNKIIIILEN